MSAFRYNALALEKIKMELVKDSLDWLKLFRLANKNLRMSDEFEIKELPRLSEIVSNNSDLVSMEQFH